MMLFIAVVYTLVLSYIFIYSLYQLLLVVYYLKASLKPTKAPDCTYFPMVTVQLPVYNEKYVVARLIDSILSIDWPKEKLEIQLLDDSTDNTGDIIAEKVNFYKNKGFEISHVTRENRLGFKAGALENGMSLCKGEFIAIFDSDFLPKRNFLKSTFGYFNSKNVGVVQSRWSHINEKYSLLTRLQAFALNGHFTIEQKGRSEADFFINFNGTAGVWRKKCIEDAGGWQSDTLTEDLDLSYRAQLKGWKFVYREDVDSPAELPISISALKNQQFRWSKGAAECARKNLSNVIHSKQLTFFQKVSAFFHLTNSLMFVCMLILMVLSVPIVYMGLNNMYYESYLGLTNVFVVSTFFLGITYFVANYSVQNPIYSTIRFVCLFPLFLSFCMGIGLYVSYGVIQGFFNVKSDFVRTPKYNVVDRMYLGANVYDRIKFKPILVFEFMLMIYSFIGVFYCFDSSSYYMLVFISMIAVGTGYSSFNTIKHALVK